jgi:hypothetical protein
LNSFIGHFADLTNYRVGSFLIEKFLGRDASGAPVWRIVHEDAGCNCPQTLPHSKIAPLVQGRHSQITLLCANPVCPQSHRQSQSETHSEFRKRELRESEKAARVAAEEKLAADAQAEKDRKQTASDAEIQRQYIRYVHSQWAAKQNDEKICTRQRWFELTPGTRQIVNDLVQKDPTVRIAGL